MNTDHLNIKDLVSILNHDAVKVDVSQLLTSLIFHYSKLRDVILKQDCSCIKDKYLR